MGWHCRPRAVKFSCVLMSLFLGSAASGQKPVEFAKRKIAVGGHSLTVEIADTEEKITRGLMYRKEPLTDDAGMLFVFKDEKIRTFWMKNTFIPLSAGFFDRNKQLVHFTRMQPVRSEMETPKTYPSGRPAMYVLEVASGWFERKKIALGAEFRFENQSP